MAREMPLLIAVAASMLASGVAFAEDIARESAVFEAAFRQQIEEHLDATERSRGTVLCLAIDPGGAPQSPSQALMLRLSGKARVRRAAECDRRPAGAVEAMTLRPAIIVTVGPIDWVAEDEARVAVYYFRSARMSAHRTYRVVKERSGWVSLGPIMIDGPA
jgi:hypothetical protein